MANAVAVETTGTPVTETGRKRVIDLVFLAKQTLGDRGLEQEVLRIFERVVNTYMTGVKNAQSEAELKVNLHSLKGASAGIGAHGLADVARAAEEELRESGKLSSEAISDLEMMVEEVSVFIGELLAA